MTAIVGFNCPDGVVLAADTEEQYGSDKVYSHKLFPVERDNSRLCVAGAGLGYLIDYANEQIVSALDAGIRDTNEFRARLGDILDVLYDDTFTKFPVDSPTDIRIDLLVAVQFSNGVKESNWTRPALFECRSNLVTRIEKSKQACIAGTGELLKQLSIQFAGWGLDTTLAEWASICVIHYAKRRFGGIGGKTHLFTMRKDGTHSYDRGVNWHEKEMILDGFSRASELLMLSLLPSLRDARAHDFTDAVVSWVDSAREHLRKVEAEGSKAKHASFVIRSREIEEMLRHLRSTTQSTSQTSEPEQ